MRHRPVTIGLCLVAYIVAFLQRPGEVIAETKVDLYVDPSRFLSNVLSVWSPTVDLGHVFGAQYSGYVWPMAPWYALGEAAGPPTWVVQRLWLGTLLALAAWGMVRLVRALTDEASIVMPLVAGALYAFNPYTTVYAGRTSITLLTYAALPWLMLAVHRGLRDPQGWRWPAVFALVLTSTGGGVNVAVTAWVLLGPMLFALYEAWCCNVSRRALWQWLWRLSLITTMVQLWWLIPVAVQAVSAPSFLPFAEQPGTIWSTTSLSESLRLMGFWTSYVGVGYGGELRPFQATATAMLQLLPVVLAGLLVGALSLLSFIPVRRWRYAPFFALTVVAGLLIMSVGWPDGTPLRRGVTAVYYRVDAVQFIRTTYKGGALTALGLAMLGGAGAAWAWRQLADPWKRSALGAGLVAVMALAAWPLVRGQAMERQLAFSVPAAWKQVAVDLDQRPGDTRALSLPGSLFGYYRWGGTVDPILPALTKHPVTARWIVPYGDLRATQLHWTVDALVTQDRLYPGQLTPLLDLLSVGDVVVGTDGDRSRSGEAPPGQVARTLAAQGLRPTHAYGPVRELPDDPRALAPPVRAPVATRTARPAPPMLSVLTRSAPVLIDGGAGGVAALAAFGALDVRRPISYAPDLSGGQMRELARRGAHVVISDTNRRSAFVASKLVGSRGPVLTADQGVSIDGTILDPWFGFSDHETVAELSGVRRLFAPASPQVTQFPERRPFAAFDGDPATAWMADRALARPRHRLTVTFERPQVVRHLDLLPYSDSRGVVRRVSVDGRSFPVRRGWNRLVLDGRRRSSLTVAIEQVDRPRDATAGVGGLRELRIPGVAAREALRPPVTASKALAGADLKHASVTYLLARDSADRPARQSRYVGERGAGLLADAQDPELTLRRVLDPPERRDVMADAWATIPARTGDDVIDALHEGRLQPRPGAPQATSSSRFDGQGRFRASGAFDRGRREWIGQWIAGRPAWIGWRTAGVRSITSLRLTPSIRAVRRPTQVVVSTGTQRTPPLAVASDGVLRLPRPLVGRRFRMEIRSAAFRPGTRGRARQRRAVGIGEIAGAGMPALVTPSTGQVAAPCGAAVLRVGPRAVPMRFVAGDDALDRGAAIRMRACRGTVPIGPGRTSVAGVGAPLRLDAVRLRSAARSPLARAAMTPGKVTDAGSVQRDGGRKAAAVQINEPVWLVFGQSFNRRWRAWCDGRDLGSPVPIQGYANGWPLNRPCSNLQISFGPQATVRAGYLISLIAILVSLVILALAPRGRHWVQVHAVHVQLPEPHVPARLPLVRAAALAVLPTLVMAFGFGLRAGVVAGPLIVLVLWRAISDQWLTRAAAAALLVGVPLVYGIGAVIYAGDYRGGNATDFAADRRVAHWLTVLGLWCVAVVLARSLRTAKGPGEASAESSASAQRF